MQPSHHRFYISGQKAGRAKESQNQQVFDQEQSWFKTALMMEKQDQRESASKAFNMGLSKSRQISGGMYL